MAIGKQEREQVGGIPVVPDVIKKYRQNE